MCTCVRIAWRVWKLCVEVRRDCFKVCRDCAKVRGDCMEVCATVWKCVEIV